MVRVAAAAAVGDEIVKERQWGHVELVAHGAEVGEQVGRGLRRHVGVVGREQYGVEEHVAAGRVRRVASAATSTATATAAAVVGEDEGVELVVVEEVGGKVLRRGRDTWRADGRLEERRDGRKEVAGGTATGVGTAAAHHRSVQAVGRADVGIA